MNAPVYYRHPTTMTDTLRDIRLAFVRVHPLRRATSPKHGCIGAGGRTPGR